MKTSHDHCSCCHHGNTFEAVAVAASENAETTPPLRFENYIPLPVRLPEDDCGVCTARLRLEAVLADLSSFLSDFEKRVYRGRASAATRSAANVSRLRFERLTAAYRVAFSFNLAIWFAQERHAMPLDVQLLDAHDDYLEQVEIAMRHYRVGENGLEDAAATVSHSRAVELRALHESLDAAFDAYLAEMHGWMKARR